MANAVLEYQNPDTKPHQPDWNLAAVGSFVVSLFSGAIVPAFISLYLAWVAMRRAGGGALRGTFLAYVGIMISTLALIGWGAALTGGYFPLIYDPSGAAEDAAVAFYKSLVQPHFDKVVATTANIPEEELRVLHARAKGWGTYVDYGFGYKAYKTYAGRPTWLLDGGPYYSLNEKIIFQVIVEKQPDGNWRVINGLLEEDPEPPFSIGR